MSSHQLHLAQEKATARRVVPVSLGKPSLRRRLEDYYSLVAPEQLIPQEEWISHKFEAIWNKYGGSDEGEALLAKKLSKKYGTTVRFLTVENAGLSNRQQQQQQQNCDPARNTEKQFSEEFYELTEGQRGSGILSFADPNFDPQAALQLPASATYQSSEENHEAAILLANPWLKESSQLLNRVELFRPFLPLCDPLYRPPSALTRSKRPLEIANRSRPGPPSLFSSMAQSLQHGPYSILYHALIERQRIRVVIRYVNGIRGTLTGYLLVFDKHFNMILRDVDEVYSPRQVSTSRDKRKFRGKE